jgi:hypothetical protein
MAYLVERAKLCLDFAATFYIWHLIFCWLFYGFPTSPSWWLVSGTALIIMAALGEYIWYVTSLSLFVVCYIRCSVEIYFHCRVSIKL